MYKKMLVALDGSALAEAALPHAVAIGRAFEAQLTLFSVIEAVGVHPQPGAMGPIVGITVSGEDEKQTVRDYLQQLADRLEDEGLYDVAKVVRDGDPASEICDYAEANGIDLLVMSTHGRSGIQRWVYGSVADRVLRAARVPVLLIRAEDL